MDSTKDGNLSKLQKMTRSLSFKINGSTKEHVSRNAAKKSLPGPRKLDVDNWFQEKRSTQVKESPPGNLRSLNSVGAKASMWTKFADGHKEKQSLNPFSDSFDKDKLKSMLLSKDDPNYGKPDKNSASAIRAAAGEAKMRGDICDVCEEKMSTIYNRINDKVVGLLIRARKKNLLSFEGEMLYQGKDDDEWIVLTKTINTIRVYFGRDGDIPGGGDIDQEVSNNSTKSILDDMRRNSTVSTASLPNTLPKERTIFQTKLRDSSPNAIRLNDISESSDNVSNNQSLKVPPDVQKAKLSNKGQVLSQIQNAKQELLM